MTPSDLLDDLQRPWKHGEHLDGRGLVLNDPLVLDGLTIRGFDLSEAVLKGGLSARGTRFRGLAWLRHAKVDGLCDLTGAEFRIDLRADGMRAGDLVLDSCVFHGVLSLAGAELSKLSLKRARIMANLTLEDARIGGAVQMPNAEVMGGFWTAGAKWGSLDQSDADIFGRIRLPD